MAAYHYDFRVALVKGSPNTVAANSTVLVYDPLDTAYATPLQVYSDPGLTTVVNLVSDQYGIVPDFWSAKPNLLWKSGTLKGGWATNTAIPGVQGPTGPAGQVGPAGPAGTAGLNGAGTNAAVAAYVNVSGETRDALDARYPLASTTAQNLGGKVAKGELEVNVRDNGAKGDGVTDDTASINAALAAGAGRVVRVPKGTYMINAVANTGQGGQPTGLQMNTAGTKLLLEQGAVLQAMTNTSTGYAVIQVTAADCVIEGGTVNGDMLAHTATGGEWGHCIELAGGADRAVIRGTRVANAWGDGVLVWNRPKDVTLLGVVADNNRRQGCSVIDAIRPKLIGCTFQNTGRTKLTMPGAGLDIEPDPGTSRDVIDALVSGCVFDNNAGAGFMIAGQGRTTTATITGCRSTNNSNHGYWATLTATGVVMTGCTARNNGASGFAADDGAAGISYESCHASYNAGHGFLDKSARSIATGCTTRSNVASGFYTDSASSGMTLVGCTAVANCSGQATLANFDLNGPTPTLSGCTAVAGTNATVPGYGFAVRAGATGAQLTGAASSGSYGTGHFLNAASAYANPTPGDTSAQAKASKTPFTTKTGNYTVALTDALIVCNGAAVTLTMPDPTTVPGGQQLLVKNINTANATVVSAGASKTLDGAASLVLARWSHIVLTSDGTQWLTI